MVENFHRILTLLRREKGVSQRTVAHSLGVSQALMSHYEKGAREPGLEFVIRAADYYGVSVDYMLGRTAERDGRGLFAVPDDTAEAKEGTSLPVSRRQILTNSIKLVYSLLERLGDPERTDAACNYLALAVYKVFRYLHMNDQQAPEGSFAVADGSFSELSDVCMKKAEVTLKKNCRYRGHTDPVQIHTGYEALKSDYPELSSSIVELLHTTDERVSHEQ